MSANQNSDSYYKIATDTLGSTDGLKNIYVILIVATILTIFEIVFFYIIVAPGVVSQMNSQLTTIGKSLGKQISQKCAEVQQKNDILDGTMPFAVESVFNNRILNIFNTVGNREKLLVDKINYYTKYTGLLIIVFLLIIMVMVRGMILKQNDNGPLSKEHTTAILTVSTLISFQIMFYFFGQKFQYPVGENELQYVMLSGVDV